VDPDEALERLRRWTRDWHTAVADGQLSAERDAASEAIEAAMTLDAWLSRGGAFPLAWQAKRNGAAPAG
jgi:hypothetical protein